MPCVLPVRFQTGPGSTAPTRSAVLPKKQQGRLYDVTGRMNLMYLFFDTETSDKPRNWKAPTSEEETQDNRVAKNFN